MQEYERLEEEFGNWVKRPDGRTVVCSSGTSALHLAFESLPIPKGSEVLVPDYAMLACARAVSMAGLVPVFADVDNSKLLLDFDNHVCEWDTIKAVLAVHTYGRRCDMKAIHKAAEYWEFLVVEDLAEGHGIPIHPKTDAACYSFYRNKIVSGEEGGAVAFRKTEHAYKARQLRSLGFNPLNQVAEVPRGINARLSNANARQIRNNLDDVENNLIRRAVVAGWYDEFVPDEWRMPQRDVVWVYDLRIPNCENNRWIVDCLNNVGVQARLGFKPLSTQPEYAMRDGAITASSATSPNAWKAAREVIYLPVDPRCNRSDVKRVVNILRSIVGRM